MAYTPTTWKRGDIVTSEKLNKIENGIVEAGVMPVITITASGAFPHVTFTCDKEHEELYEMGNVQVIVRHNADETGSDFWCEIGEVFTGVEDDDPVDIHCVHLIYSESPHGFNVSGSKYTVANDNTVTSSPIYGFSELT